MATKINPAELDLREQLVALNRVSKTVKGGRVARFAAIMVVGVTKGFSKTLEIIGVGYKAAKVGKTVQLYLGHSLLANGTPQEKFCITEPEGITLEVAEKAVPITITVKGIDKQAVGQMAAVIRGKRPPEPYHGKGVKYSDERVRRKAGKTGK